MGQQDGCAAGEAELPSLAPRSALVTRWFVPPQFDFTSYQGVLFVMLMVLFFGGIILAVILPYQYVSDDPSPSFAARCQPSWLQAGSGSAPSGRAPGLGSGSVPAAL